MDAARAPVADDLAAELDALRRRAYGPGRGIADDAVALARLTELEAAARGVPASTTALRTSEAAAEASVAVVRDPAGSVTSGAVVRDPAPSADVVGGPAAPSAPAPWWRRRRTWLAGAAAIGVAAIALTVVLAVNSGPDAVLGRARVQATPETGAFDQGMLDYFALQATDLVAREEYQGLSVWSALNDNGRRCLFIGWGGSLWNGTCVPTGLDPIVDVTVDPGLPVDLGRIPSGSVVRFTLVGDSVEVRVAYADVGA